MAEVHTEILIDRSPDDVWAVLSDFGGLSTWLPAVQESSLDGDTRRIVFGPDFELVEKILTVDPGGRTFTYTIIESPAPFEEYQSTMMVLPDGDGSKVIWSATLSPADSASFIESTYGDGLRALKSHLEG